ncbi:hypothetical protein [Synechococcus sp. M16CYN]|uniref:hypothetical protein n=1 Tax=Synechococcus sp. M16CYN TaxID=3103139 RepID=UPI0033409AF1
MAPLPSRATLLRLEQEARRFGSGVQADQLSGCWRLRSTWKRCGHPSAQAIDFLLCALNACLILTKSIRNDRFKIVNQVSLGSLQLSFQGLAHLKGKRPLLCFKFVVIELKLGNQTLLKQAIKSPAFQRQPFFALISLDPVHGWLIARGRGGGLALWTSQLKV